MSEEGPRVTSSHASEVFQGSFMGVETAHFPWVALALLASLGLFVGLFYGADWGFMQALKWAVLPSALVILYLRLAHQGRPPHFTMELFHELLTGGHVAPPRQMPPHPFHHE